MTTPPDVLKMARETAQYFESHPYDLMWATKVAVNAIMAERRNHEGFNDLLIAAQEENSSLRHHLEEMVKAFRPFTSKPVGMEGSPARLDQEHQTKVWSEAKAAIRTGGE